MQRGVITCDCVRESLEMGRPAGRDQSVFGVTPMFSMSATGTIPTTLSLFTFDGPICKAQPRLCTSALLTSVSTPPQPRPYVPDPINMSWIGRGRGVLRPTAAAFNPRLS